MTLIERIEEIDRILFDAGVMILSATTKQARKEADRKVTEARIQLDKLKRGTL